MRVSFTNVGCLHDTNVECAGLTVICGMNGTGKSTILKTIYATLSPAMYFDDLRGQQVLETIRHLSCRHLNDDLPLHDRDVSDEELMAIIQRLDGVMGETDPDRDLLGYAKALIDSSEEVLVRLYDEMVRERIVAEFDGPNHFRTMGVGGSTLVRFTEGPTLTCEVCDDAVSCVGDRDSIPGIVYWDSFFDIDRRHACSGIRNNHCDDLAMLLESRTGGNAISGPIFEANVRRFDEAVGSVFGGKLENSEDGLRYRSACGSPISTRNVAAGIGVFATIRMLLEKGILHEGSVLMLDEPEAHLHPRWINVLGDTISILVRELHIRILLTTNNPQLLMALESSSRGDDRVRCYNLKRIGDGSSVLEDVSVRLEQVYDEMSAPIQEVASRFWERSDGPQGDARRSFRSLHAEADSPVRVPHKGPYPVH